MAKQNNGNGASSNGHAPDPPLTPIEAWQRMRVVGTVSTLPSSGRVVRWRPVELLVLFAEGKIPDKLTAYVASRVWEGKAEDKRSDQEKAADWIGYLNMVRDFGVMDLDVSALKSGDFLYPELVDFEDLVTNAVKAVLPFPVKQAGDVDAGTEGGQVQPVAE